MLAGSWIPLDYHRPQPYTFEKFLEYNLKEHYSLWKWENTKLRPLLRNRIQKCVGNIPIYNKESYVNAIELFNFNERQAKHIVNSVRVYEFFKYQWRIPLWDTELIDFFLKVSLVLRVKQILYRRYVMKKLFLDDFKILQDLDCTTDIKDNGLEPPVLNMKIFVKNLPLAMKLRRHIHTFWRIRTEYDNFPFAWYGMLSKDQFMGAYSGTEVIESFIGPTYIRKISPSSLNVLVEKCFMETGLKWLRTNV